MTICIATSNYFPDTGGIATYSRRLAILLSKAGHKAIVLTIDTNTHSDENDTVETDENSVQIIKLKKSFHKHYSFYKKYFKQGNIDAPYWIAMGFAMQEWLSKNQAEYSIDIIEASAFGGIGSFLKEPSFPPVVLSGHGTFFQYKRFNFNKTDEQTKLIEKLERLAFSNANAIISHSPQSKKDIERFTNAPVYIARIAFFPEYNSITTDATEAIRTKKYALVVGSLQNLKGPFTLFDAIASLNIPDEDFEIIWAGSDNYFQESGELMSVELAKRYPSLWNKIILWKKSPNDIKLTQLYQNASFIIIPTIWESYNVISIEAAFFKKPVIITKTTGSSFLFSNEENAIIIEPDNSEALAKAILRLYNDTDLCKQLGEASYKHIKEHLDPNKIVEERIAIYNKMIQNRSGSNISFDPSIFKRYTTIYRKVYFACRQFIKSIFKN